MADAVGAERTFFTTCGSSLSVKGAMLTVAGPHEKLVVGSLAHPPAAYAAAFEQYPDARGALVTSPTPYGICADLSAISQVCHHADGR